MKIELGIVTNTNKAHLYLTHLWDSKKFPRLQDENEHVVTNECILLLLLFLSRFEKCNECFIKSIPNQELDVFRNLN